MKEVKSPKKPLIYYYSIILLIVLLFNLIVSPLLMKNQVTEVDYGTFMRMIEEKNIGEVEVKGSEIIDEARRQGKRIIVLAGRPYHVDPEINHGIDKLAASLGFAVVSEDSVCQLAQRRHADGVPDGVSGGLHQLLLRGVDVQAHCLGGAEVKGRSGPRQRPSCGQAAR